MGDTFRTSILLAFVIATAAGCNRQPTSWVGEYEIPAPDILANENVSLNLRDVGTYGRGYWLLLSIKVNPDNTFEVTKIRENYRQFDRAKRFALISTERGKLGNSQASKFRSYLSVLRPKALSNEFDLSNFGCFIMDAAPSISVTFVDKQNRGGGFIYWPDCDDSLPLARKSNLRRLLTATRQLIPARLAQVDFESTYPTISSGLKK